MSKFKKWVAEHESDIMGVIGVLSGAAGCMIGIKIGNAIYLKRKGLTDVSKMTNDVLHGFKDIHCWKAVKDITVNDAIVDVAHDIIMNHRLNPDEIVKGIIITTK